MSQRVIKKCLLCDKIFTIKKYRLKHKRGVFCSIKCKKQYTKPYGKNKKIKFRCPTCGVDFFRYKNKKIIKTKYCSMSCRNKHMRGKNHPLYINGESSYKRGTNWQAQKRKAKFRDQNTCQKCGINGSKEKSLHVHHIIPYRLFKNYKKANVLDNLITLCERCHRLEELKNLKKYEK